MFCYYNNFKFGNNLYFTCFGNLKRDRKKEQTILQDEKVRVGQMFQILENYFYWITWEIENKLFQVNKNKELSNK